MYNVPGSTADGQVDSFHYLDYVFLVFECEGYRIQREKERETEREGVRDQQAESVRFIQTEPLQDPVDPCRFNIAIGGQMYEREK